MRTRTEGDYIFTYPDESTPIFGADIYVSVRNIGAPIPNGTEDVITISISGGEAIPYKSVWMNNYIYFYFDIKLPKTTILNRYPITARYGTSKKIEWDVLLGAWENRGVRDVNKIRANSVGIMESVYVEEGKTLYIKEARFGISYIRPYPLGNINLSSTTATSFSYILDSSTAPTPDSNDSRWTSIPIDSICSRFKIVEQKEKFRWIDRNGYTHTYYFDVNEMSEGRGDSTEYVKTRLSGTNTINYTTSLSVPRIKKGYISNYENQDFLKDLITLGSCLYLEVNDIPVDPKKISGLGVSGASKGLEVITFSIDYEIKNKNTILW